MKLLHIDSSILGDMSASRVLSKSVVARLRSLNPEIEDTYRDLGRHPVSHLAGAYLASLQGQVTDLDPLAQDDVATGRAVLAEFLAADIVVIGVPLYNLTIPSQLKSWIDRIVIVGQTFRYDVEGRPVGMVRGKRLYLAITRGGLYGAGAAGAALEHGESYLRAIFGFLGMTDPECIIAEGLALGPDHRAAAMTAAQARILEHSPIERGHPPD